MRIHFSREVNSLDPDPDDVIISLPYPLIMEWYHVSYLHWSIPISVHLSLMADFFFFFCIAVRLVTLVIEHGVSQESFPKHLLLVSLGFFGTFFINIIRVQLQHILSLASTL